MNNEYIKSDQLQRLKKISMQAGIRSELLPVLSRHGFIPSAMPHEISTGILSFYGSPVIGICMRNKNGGYYFYSERRMERPVFLSKEGSVTVHYNHRTPSRSCILFWDLYDLMSYYTLRYCHMLPSGIPVDCDCIVIGSHSNYVSAMLDCECYDKTYMLLPNTCIGRTMSLTMVSPNPTPCRNRQNCLDISGCYRDYDSLYDYLRSRVSTTAIRKEIV